MPEHPRDSAISPMEAAESIRWACLYTNDNADPAGIDSATKPDQNSEFVVSLYRGCNLTNTGRMQRFRVSVIPID